MFSKLLSLIKTSKVSKSYMTQLLKFVKNFLMRYKNTDNKTLTALKINDKIVFFYAELK